MAVISITATPNARVLVCAPSNKAVQEVLERFRRDFPMVPVMFVGNKRRPLPPAVQEVFADDFLHDRKKRLEEYATAKRPIEVEAICADLERYRMLEVLAGAVSAVGQIRRQCGRLKRGECWSCGRVDPCSSCGTGSWAEGSNAMKALINAMTSVSSTHTERLIRNSRVVFATLATSGRPAVKRALEVPI